jgi:hypothetical protein
MIYGLLNNDMDSSDCTTSNVRIISEYELERMSKEAIMV